MQTTTFVSIILSLFAAQAIYTIADLAPVVDFVVPIAQDAVQHQEDTVSTYENLFPESAKAARKQWDGRKLIANERIESFKNLK